MKNWLQAYFAFEPQHNIKTFPWVLLSNLSWVAGQVNTVGAPVFSKLLYHLNKLRNTQLPSCRGLFMWLVAL